VTTLRFVYWQDDAFWLGYLDEFPDYMTQGETLDELKENLRDVYKDLSNGLLPIAKRVGELAVAGNVGIASDVGNRWTAC
jgi:hypothetical protein